MRTSPRLQRDAGFTLIEIVAALAVMGVAIYIIISMFLASVEVGESARLRATAAGVASERMQALSAAPGLFVWPPLHDAVAGEILPGDEADEWHAITLPEALPSAPRARERELAFYERFGWRAYARSVEDAPGVIEVSVVVHWTHRGRPQSFVLTSAVARGALPDSGGAA